MQEQLQQFASQLDALREENIQLKRQMGEDRDRNAAQLAVVSDRVKALEAQLQKAEVSRRAENMVIHGLEEQDGVTATVAVARACRDVGLPESSWRDAFRLGRERRGPDNRPRPILVKFDSKEAKHRVFSRSKALRDHQVYLDDDLTAEQQATRRSLAGEYQKLKMAKLKPFYRQERLLYVHRGRVVQHQVGLALPGRSQASQGPYRTGPQPDSLHLRLLLLLAHPSRRPGCLALLSGVQQPSSRHKAPPRLQGKPLRRRLQGKPLHRQLRGSLLHRQLQGR